MKFVLAESAYIALSTHKYTIKLIEISIIYIKHTASILHGVYNCTLYVLKFISLSWLTEVCSHWSRAHPYTICIPFGFNKGIRSSSSSCSVFFFT